jgi:rhamnose transport system permease protein
VVIFLAAALVFGFILHFTVFGRWVYAIGNNPVGARFSGVRVERVKFTLFMMTGLMAGVAAVCLTSRLGSTRPSIAFGWELEIVTMVVLGGVAILGGSGSILGAAIAAVIMGMITFGLGLLNVPGIVMSIFVGLLLITVIALPNVLGRFRGRTA